MGCPKSCDDTTVERTEELPATPDEVWDALPALFEGDDERLRIDIDSVPGERLTFIWADRDDDDPPSYVDIELEQTETGTIVHIRETRCDGDALIRSSNVARAGARA